VRSRSRIARVGPLVLVLTITSCAAACQSGPSRSTADAAPVTGVTELVAKDLRFQPPAIQVPPGTEVTWRFDDGSVPHNVKGDGFASKNQTSGTFTRRFDRPGEYRYTCTLHAGMDGRVVVTG
jgi:plastocyanin